jgi:hypothetical protein
LRIRSGCGGKLSRIGWLTPSIELGADLIMKTKAVVPAHLIDQKHLVGSGEINTEVKRLEVNSYYLDDLRQFHPMGEEH